MKKRQVLVKFNKSSNFPLTFQVIFQFLAQMLLTNLGDILTHTFT